ncbi:MAG: class I SAM-dependent methyltransferase [Acidobacteria bacterium]|nr:class I SAM-dependent methyltransferase [Acidobacteriota bacterium]
MRIDAIAARAAEFQARLDQVKTGLGDPGFDWYPYDSLGNFFTLDAMLTGGRRDFLNLTGGSPVLDIGCADGGMALFLDSLGCEVHAIDNPETNHNGMAGVRRLAQAMGARISVYERDIDQDLQIPAAKYSLTLLLGVLYHLKNPFRILEALSRHSRYLVLSTRVARRGPEGTVLEGLPVAYLVGRGETNNDATNYWVFTHRGLDRLLERTGWRVLDAVSVGATDSDPASEAGDERRFVFAENARQPVTGGRMTGGWYEQEGWETWRWTAPRFSVEFAAPGRNLAIALYVPESLIAARGGVTLAASVDGIPLPPARYDRADHYVYTAALRGPAGAGPVRVDVVLDGGFTPVGDERELGVVVSEVTLR